MVRPKLRLVSDFEKNKTCVFFVHGGAFISNSSYSYINFTINLSKMCHIPIYSMDYSYSPENKYPHQLEECFEEYMWLL